MIKTKAMSLKPVKSRRRMFFFLIEEECCDEIIKFEGRWASKGRGSMELKNSMS